MTLKIQANKELFDLWNQLGSRISDLRSIVQNDMEISEEDLNEWLLLATKSVNLTNILIYKTQDYINKNNPKEN